MRMGGARAHQRSSPGRGVDRVGSCPSSTFRSYVSSVGGGDGVRSGIGCDLFGQLFGGGPLLLVGVWSCIEQSSEDG